MSTTEIYGATADPQDEGEPPSESQRLRSWQYIDCHDVDIEYEMLIDWYRSQQDDEARTLDELAEIRSEQLKQQALHEYDSPLLPELSGGRLRKIIKSLFRSSII